MRDLKKTCFYFNVIKIMYNFFLVFDKMSFMQILKIIMFISILYLLKIQLNRVYSKFKLTISYDKFYI